MKKVGLAQDSKMLLKFTLFSKELNKQAQLAMFFNNSKSYYRCFKKIFRDGCVTITTIQGTVHHIPNTEDLSAALVLYHFAVELILKALILFKNPEFNDRTHEIHGLVEDIIKFYGKDYPEVFQLSENQEYKILIEQIGQYAIAIRYGEGSISLRHNNKKGWANKKPLEELSESLDRIYEILKSVCDDVMRLS